MGSVVVRSGVITSRKKWLEERRYGIGASDAGVILGYSPWKTNVELWEEKVGQREPEDIGGKPYVKYGNDAEPLLRELFALDFPAYEVSYIPYHIIRNSQKPYIFATPDGELIERETGRRGGLEIKTTEIMTAVAWTKWKDRIPDLYYAQVLHQLLAVEEWQFVVLKAQLKHRGRDGAVRLDTRHYHIERAEVKADIVVLEQAVTEFWHCAEARRRPSLTLPPI